MPIIFLSVSRRIRRLTFLSFSFPFLSLPSISTMPVHHHWILGDDEFPTNLGGGAWAQENRSSEGLALPAGTWFLHWGGSNWHWRARNDGYFGWFHRLGHRHEWRQWAQTGGVGIRPNDLPFQHEVTQPPTPIEASTQTEITMRDDPVTYHPTRKDFQLLTNVDVISVEAPLIQYVGPSPLVAHANARAGRDYAEQHPNVEAG